jgi:hypothetical protein
MRKEEIRKGRGKNRAANAARSMLKCAEQCVEKYFEKRAQALLKPSRSHTVFAAHAPFSV